MTEEELDALVKAMDGEAGDLLLFAADKNKIVWDVLGNLRLEIARNLDLLDKNVYKFLWVTEFPEFEYSEEQGRYVAMHHPFTMPMEEDIPLLKTNRESTRQSIRYRAERYRAWWWFHPYSSGRCTGNDV